MADSNWQLDPSGYIAGAIGGPVSITSGYRTVAHNAAVGGVPNSAHLSGQAYDFVPRGMSTAQAAQKLASSGVPFDQVINEGDHVHVSFAPSHRGQVLNSQPQDVDFVSAIQGAAKQLAPAPQNTASGDTDFVSAIQNASPAKGQKGTPAPGGTPANPPPPMNSAITKVPFGLGSDVVLKLPFAKDVVSGSLAGLDYLADKAEGKTGPTFGQRYANNLDTLNAVQAKYEQQNPNLGTLGSVLSVFAAGNPSQGAAFTQPASLGQRVWAGAKSGGALGGLFGLGQAGGDVGDRLTRAAESGIIGAGVGGAIPLIGAALKPVGQAAGNAFHKVGEMTGLSEPNYQGMAQDELGTALARDQVNPADIASQLAASGGKPVTAMDVGGTNTQRLARKLVTQPGEAGDKITQFLSERSQDQGGRVLSDITKHLSQNTDVYGVADDLMAQRSQQSAPLWQKAMSQPPVITDRLKSFAEDPDIQQGMKQGIALARREALAKGIPFDPNAYAITDFNAAGEPQIGKVPTWRTWQAAKEGLDERIESFRDGVTGKLPSNKTVNSLISLKNSLVNELKSVNPEYGPALAAWAGPSQSKTALDMGEAFLRADPEQIKTITTKLSPADLDFYRIGAARAIQDKANAAADSADLSKRLFGNARIRDQIETVFGEKAADAFGEAMGAEGKMASTSRFVLGGSNTANKLADVADSGNQFGRDMVLGTLHGGPKAGVISATLGAAHRGINNLFNPPLNPMVANHVATALTASGQGATDIYTRLAAEQAARRAAVVSGQNRALGANRLISGFLAQLAASQNNNLQQ